MIAILWRYAVNPDRAQAFEACYGPHGDWAQLFARGAGYVGTDLWRGEDGAYLTLDRWTDLPAYDAFKQTYAAAYASLDAACDPLTDAETRLGVFECVE
jgi:hypothetical protein